MSKKRELHKSQIAMHERCPRQYFYRYVEDIIRPPASAMLIGTGTHKAAAVDLTAKRDTGKLLGAEEVVSVAVDTLKTEWAKGVELDPAEKLLGEKRAKGEAVDAVVALAGLHHKSLAPALKPKLIEQPFTVVLEGFPVDLAGTMDLQEQDGTVRDLKTRNATPPEGFADSCLDLSCYGLAARARDGVAPASLAMDFLVKTKTPKLVTQRTTRSDNAYRAFLLRVEAVSKAIESGAFPPCSPDSWVCSEKFCGYWTICDFGRAARVTG